MARKEIKGPINDSTLNNTNHNFKELYDGFNNVVEEVSNKAYAQVVDAAKINWKDPVTSFNNLPSGASEGDTRMARDTGKVYRFDSSNWNEIQQIDAGPVNEVDTRLTQQLAETEQELNGINDTLREEVLAVDIQGIDEQALESRNERMPVVIKDRVAEQDYLVNGELITSNDKHSIKIPRTTLRKYKNFELFVTNQTGVDLRIGFSDDDYATHVVLEDGSFVAYGTGTAECHHTIPNGIRNVRLSDVPAKTGDNDIKSKADAIFKGMVSKSELRLEYRCMGEPNGNLTIALVGVPN